MCMASPWRRALLLVESDLRSRFMAVAGDTTDAEGVWRRMRASMDEDEIEGYIEDLESRGQRMVDHDDSWEDRARTIRAAWGSGEPVSFARSSYGDLGTEPHTLRTPPYLEELLHRAVEEAWDSFRQRAASPASDADDGMLGALESSARRMLDRGKLNSGRDRIEFDPVEVYVLRVGVNWVVSDIGRGSSLGSAVRDRMGRLLRTLVTTLVVRDVGEHDPAMREFIGAYEEFLRLPKAARERAW